MLTHICVKEQYGVYPINPAPGVPGGGLNYNLSVKSWALGVKRSNFYLSAVLSAIALAKEEAVFAEVELSTFNVYLSAVALAKVGLLI